MRIKLYGRVIGIFLKKHSFINVLISLQLIAVFVIGIIMTSIIDEKASSYEAVKPLLNGEGLYCGGYFLKDNEIQRINNKNYPTKVGSLVSCTDSEGKRMYKMKAAKPPIESLAYTVYEKFGAKLEDVLAKSGDKNGQA